MPEKEVLSNYLKEWRYKNKESQFEFAGKIGISVEELSKLERMLGNPKLGTLQKIAAYTGNTVAELLDIAARKGCEMEMYQALMEKYFDAEKFLEKETYMVLLESLEKSLDREKYMDFEEKLNEMMIQMKQEAFLAGCRMASESSNCIYCTRLKE